MKKIKLDSLYLRNVSISYPRILDIIKPGDIINGSSGVSISANYVEYKVTHVAWWGVYAVPTESMLEGMSKDWTTEFINGCRKHFKFKWQNIYKIKLI
jgi:hypothetical protein